MSNKSELFTGLENLVLGGSILESPVDKTNQEKEVFGLTLDQIEKGWSKEDSKDSKDSKETPEQIIEEVKKEGIQLTEEEILAGNTKQVVNNEKTEKETAEEVIDNNQSNNSNIEVFKVVSEMFKSEGLIEEDFDSSEKMIEVFSNTIKAEIEDYKNSLPEVVKDLINNYEEGVPLEDLIQSKSAQVRYTNINKEELETDEELQKNIYKDFLSKTTRFSKERIEKEVKRTADLGELYDETLTALDELTKLEKQREEQIKEQVKLEKEKSRKEHEEIMKRVHKEITSVKEIVPGIKLTDKEAEKVFKMVTTPVEVRGDYAVTQAMKVREKDPVKFDMTLNYLIEKGVFEGKWDFITNKVTTKEVNKLEKQLAEAALNLVHKGGKSADLPESDKTKSILSGYKTLKNK